MLIYHYSKSKHKELKTLEAQGLEKDVPSIKDYNKHISFFLEPIPYEFMGTIFGKDHHTWFPGNVVVEHTIIVSEIGEFIYKIVESPEKTFLYYDENITDEDYGKKLKEMIVRNKYEGSNLKEFEKIQTKLKGTVREYYAMLPERKNFAGIKDKYAATVPHTMIYPKGGIIKVKLDTREITIGTKPVPNLALRKLTNGFFNWK